MFRYSFHVVFGDDSVQFHDVWAGTKTEAVDSLRNVYRSSTIRGFVLSFSEAPDFSIHSV